MKTRVAIVLAALVTLLAPDADAQSWGKKRRGAPPVSGPVQEGRPASAQPLAVRPPPNRTPLTIVANSPVHGGLAGVNPSGALIGLGGFSVAFSRALDRRTITPENFRLLLKDKPVPIRIEYKDSSRLSYEARQQRRAQQWLGPLSSDHVVVVAPQSVLAYETRYTAVVTRGVRDLDGTPLAHEYRWIFTTHPSPEPKVRVASKWPDPSTVLQLAPTQPGEEPHRLKKGSTAQKLASDPRPTIRATFTEPLACKTVSGGTFQVVNQDGEELAGNIQCQGNTASFAPRDAIQVGAYRVHLSESITSQNGMALEVPDWFFQVGELSARPTPGKGKRGGVAPVVTRRPPPPPPPRKKKKGGLFSKLKLGNILNRVSKMVGQVVRNVQKVAKAVIPKPIQQAFKRAVTSLGKIVGKDVVLLIRNPKQIAHRLRDKLSQFIGKDLKLLLSNPWKLVRRAMKGIKFFIKKPGAAVKGAFKRVVKNIKVYASKIKKLIVAPLLKKFRELLGKVLSPVIKLAMPIVKKYLMPILEKAGVLGGSFSLENIEQWTQYFRHGQVSDAGRRAIEGAIFQKIYDFAKSKLGTYIDSALDFGISLIRQFTDKAVEGAISKLGDIPIVGWLLVGIVMEAYNFLIAQAQQAISDAIQAKILEFAKTAFRKTAGKLLGKAIGKINAFLRKSGVGASVQTLLSAVTGGRDQVNEGVQDLRSKAKNWNAAIERKIRDAMTRIVVSEDRLGRLEQLGSLGAGGLR